MATDKKSSQKSRWERIGELGPAWIAAITGVCGLFFFGGGGYIAGHISNSGANDPAPQPTVTVTVTATADATSPASGSPQTSRTSQATASNGSVLGSYTVDLPGGYSIPLGPSKPTQSEFVSSGESGDLLNMSGEPNYYIALGNDHIVLLQNDTTPTYKACSSSTAFTYDVDDGPGVAFCVLESGMIAGVEAVSQSSISGDYILDVTVWRNAS